MATFLIDGRFMCLASERFSDIDCHGVVPLGTAITIEDADHELDMIGGLAALDVAAERRHSEFGTAGARIVAS